MTYHSERTIRTRMRERGIKPNVANMERVTADIRAGERCGSVPGTMGTQSLSDVARRRAEAARASMRGGRPV